MSLIDDTPPHNIQLHRPSETISTPSQFIMEYGDFPPDLVIDPFDAASKLLNMYNSPARLKADPFDTSISTAQPVDPTSAACMVSAAGFNSVAVSSPPAMGTAPISNLPQHPWSDMVITKQEDTKVTFSSAISPTVLATSTDCTFRPRHDSLLEMSVSCEDLGSVTEAQLYKNAVAHQISTDKDDEGYQDAMGKSEHDVMGDDHERDHDDDSMDVDSNTWAKGDDSDDMSPRRSPFSRDASVLAKPMGPAMSLRPRSRASMAASTATPKTSTTSKAANKATRHEKSSSVPTRTSRRTRAKANTRSMATEAASKRSKSTGRVNGEDVEESSATKRQKFLERNRLAAAKCREKKRLQTLKTITNADVITSKNQELHEDLSRLQEEVRTLKNQILCHRDCDCEVIQKFVKTNLCTQVAAPKASSDWNRSFSPNLSYM
ncbi:hypothetical protein BGZ94_003722 [Podila epigama]|nr:hypothetical protein BGZ94_003722 [Podila epigama]